MGFFKDFKDDLSEAVDEIMPTENEEIVEDDMINTITSSVDVDSELTKLDGLLEKANQNLEEEKEIEKVEVVNTMSDYSYNRENNNVELNDYSAPKQEKPAFGFTSAPASDENAHVTGGMTITGDIETAGSIDIEGRVNGNIKCQGKLNISGMVNGNSQANEVFADAARIDGEVNATGTVKVGSGSVVIGNITATNAIIAGSVKGDIDVQGPVVIDTSAVVMGNVKSKSVQINNGAIIEGFCSQVYAETDLSSVFSE